MELEERRWEEEACCVARFQRELELQLDRPSMQSRAVRARLHI